jgi:hypothetical protein
MHARFFRQHKKGERTLMSSRVPAWKVASLVPKYRSVGVESMVAPADAFLPSASVELGLDGKPMTGRVPGVLPLAALPPKDITTAPCGFVAGESSPWSLFNIDPLGKPTLPATTTMRTKESGSPTLPESVTSEWTPSPQPVPSVARTMSSYICIHVCFVIVCMYVCVDVFVLYACIRCVCLCVCVCVCVYVF